MSRISTTKHNKDNNGKNKLIKKIKKKTILNETLILKKGKNMLIFFEKYVPKKI